MKNTYSILVATFLLSFSLLSQTHQAFTAVGGDASHSSGSIAFSVGQVFYTSTSSASGTIALGIQQPKRPTSITSLLLNLSVLIDGYYVIGSSPATMVAARYTNLVESGSTNPGLATDADIIQVELRSPSSLGNASYTVSGMLKTNGMVQCNFPSSALVGTYYIVVKHRNCLPLWSANPITFSATTIYNFTDAASKAFTDGSSPSMKELALGVYAMYTGEMNDDDYLDGSDFGVWEQTIFMSESGQYLLDGDFNGNSYVDAADYPIFDFNSQIGVYTQAPQ